MVVAFKCEMIQHNINTLAVEGMMIVFSWLLRRKEDLSTLRESIPVPVEIPTVACFKQRQLFVYIWGGVI